MTKLTNKPKRLRTFRRQRSHSNPVVVIPLALILLLTACGPHATPAAPVTVPPPAPTSTPEPTFTPALAPTTTRQPSPTSTPVEPTPTPTPQSVALSGRILDQDTDQPVAGAKVSAGAYTATTDAEGRYTLTGLPPGQYVLSVTHPDYDPGLSSIFTLAADQEGSQDLTLYAPDTSPYPQDPMLTNPLDPEGAPTAEDAERLARLQGLTGQVVNVRETKLSGEYLVNYQIGDEVRAAVAELNHEVWELTDDVGRAWWIIKVCGNMASPLPTQVAVATPQPRPLPPMAEVMVDKLIVRACASEECTEVWTIQGGARIQVIGCLTDGSWCQVDLPGSGSGWCTGRSLRQLAVAQAVPIVESTVPISPVTGTGNIELVGQIDTPGDARGVAVAGHYAYVADANGGLRIINVIDPTAATEVGFYNTPGSAVGVAVEGSYAYVADVEKGVRIINVANPVALAEVGFYSTPGYATDVVLAGHYAGIIDSNRLIIIDVANPMVPTEVGYYFADDADWISDVAVVGRYAYVAEFPAWHPPSLTSTGGGLRILDVTNPAAPTEVSFFDTPGDADGVAVAGNYAYVADGSGGLRIIDVSNLLAPAEIGFYRMPGDPNGSAGGIALKVAVAGNYAYVVETYLVRDGDSTDQESGLRVIDVTDPAVPAEVELYVTPGHIWDVAAMGDYVYVADGAAGLLILRRSGE